MSKHDDDGLSVEDLACLEAGELPRVHRLGGPVDIEDRANWADYISAVAANTQVCLLMDPSAGTLYEAAVAANNRAGGERSAPLTLLGNVLMLDALIASPEATQAMLRCLRRELAESVPELALLRK